MEPLYGSDVAGNRANGQVLVATGNCLRHNLADQPTADALIPRYLRDDDRLDFGTGTSVE